MRAYSEEGFNEYVEDILSRATSRNTRTSQHAADYQDEPSYMLQHRKDDYPIWRIDCRVRIR